MIPWFMCIATAITCYIFGWYLGRSSLTNRVEYLKYRLGIAIDDQDNAVVAKIAANQELNLMKLDITRVNTLADEEHRAHQDHLEAIQGVLDYFYDTMSGMMLEVNEDGGDRDETEAKGS